MKTILTILIFLLIITSNLNSQSASAPNYYGYWTLISTSIDGVKFEIRGTFTESYDYNTMEAINNGNFSHKTNMISSNCIVKYQIENKSKSQFIQTISTTSGSDCQYYKEGDSMIVDYSISGEIMTQTIYVNGSKIVSKYKSGKINNSGGNTNKPIIEEVKGSISLELSENACVCGNGNDFNFEDTVFLSFQSTKEVGVTNLQLWISECKNSSDNSCYTPFLKMTKDILPDWRGFKNETPISLKDLLSNSGKVKIPKRFEWYHFAVIINNKIVAENTFKIKQDCEDCKIEEFKK